MRIDNISSLADWLRSADSNVSNSGVEIARPVIDALGRLATLIADNANGNLGFHAGSLLISTLQEHARDTARLTSFACWIGSAAPQRRDAIANLLSIMGSQARDQNRLAAALDSVAAVDSGANEVVDLLNLTLAHAGATCSRYASSRYPIAITALDQMEALPVLRRNEAERDLLSICAKEAPVDFYTATSATTTGRALLVPHCRAENEAFSKYGSSDDTAVESPYGMTLRLMPAGRLIGAPLAGGDTVLATYETNALHENRWDLWDYIAAQVFVEFPSRNGLKQIQTIHATPPFGLILLTKYMLQRGMEPKDSSVKNLLVTGSWVGPTTRRWLQESWGARLHTTYSCSEIVGGAVECEDHPGRYHFGPNIFPEVLNGAGKAVAKDEQGDIYLTGLYPFQRSAVFLRYEVGDWGKLSEEFCTCGFAGRSVDFLGRTRDVLSITSSDGTRFAIPPVPVRNALDRFACVPKIPRPQYRMRLEQGTTVGLEIDVECYALAGQRWVERTRTAIAEAIIEEDSSIRKLISAGELKLNVNLFTRSTLTSRPEVR